MSKGGERGDGHIRSNRGGIQYDERRKCEGGEGIITISETLLDGKEGSTLKKIHLQVDMTV